MAVITDFFVASRSELAEIFPSWLTVAAESATRETTNPFTGQQMTVTYWPPEGPISDSPDASDELPIVGIRKLPHVEFKRVEYVKLALLDNILRETEFDTAIQMLQKPALIHPSNKDTGLQQLPEETVRVLTSLKDEQLDMTAQRWAEQEDVAADGFLTEDCTEVVRELRRLSRIACDTGKGLYLQWAL